MNPTSVIAGPSTHNERIERFWYDVFRCVGQIFYSLLYSLEEEGVLDPLNDVDLFCVHFAIMPRINHCLAEFMESWNQHRLSLEHNMTPEQLFTIGMLQHSHEGTINLPSSGNYQSINLCTVNMDDTSTVEVPPTPNCVYPILSSTFGRLSHLISNFGKDA